MKNGGEIFHEQNPKLALDLFLEIVSNERDRVECGGNLE